jgi:hypothetical protein
MMVKKTDRKKRLDVIAKIIDLLDDIPDEDIMIIMGTIMAISGANKIKPNEPFNLISKKAH